MLLCPRPVGQAAAVAPVPCVLPFAGQSGEGSGRAAGWRPGRAPRSPAADGTARG